MASTIGLATTDASVQVRQTGDRVDMDPPAAAATASLASDTSALQQGDEPIRYQGEPRPDKVSSEAGLQREAGAEQRSDLVNTASAIAAFDSPSMPAGPREDAHAILAEHDVSTRPASKYEQAPLAAPASSLGSAQAAFVPHQGLGAKPATSARHPAPQARNDPEGIPSASQDDEIQHGIRRVSDEGGEEPLLAGDVPLAATAAASQAYDLRHPSLHDQHLSGLGAEGVWMIGIESDGDALAEQGRPAKRLKMSPPALPSSSSSPTRLPQRGFEQVGGAAGEARPFRSAHDDNGTPPRASALEDRDADVDMDGPSSTGRRHSDGGGAIDERPAAEDRDDAPPGHATGQQEGRQEHRQEGQQELHGDDAPPPAGGGLHRGHTTTTTPAVARLGAKVPGSSDGGERGEECWLWSDWPMNKMGFRYMPCGPSPNLSPQPALFPFYRTIASQTMPYAPNPACVITAGLRGADADGDAASRAGRAHLDWSDRSTYLKVSASALTCTTDKGFRSARGNVAVRTGRWYFEVLILKGGGEGAAGGRRRVTRDGRVVDEDGDELFGKLAEASRAAGHRRPGGGGWADGAHVRVGWARREASLNGPVGMDGYSYGIRDGTGEKVTLSRPRPYGAPFGTGDVVGCFIDIPPPTAQGGNVADGRQEPIISRKRIPIRYKGQLYFESVDYTVAKEMDALVARDGKKDEVAAAIADGRPPADIGKPKVVEVVPPPVEKARKGVKRTNKKGDAGAAPIGGAGIDDASRPLPILPGSSVSFFLNGRPMSDEPAFRDLFDFTPLAIVEAPRGAGVVRKATNATKDRENPHDDGSLGYYPMISCYGGGKAQLNPGPRWLKSPTELPAGTRPLNERWDEWAEEERLHDEIEEAAKAEEVKNMRLSPVQEGLPKANGKVKPRSKGKLVLKRDSNTPARSTPGFDDNSSDPSASTRSTPAPSAVGHVQPKIEHDITNGNVGHEVVKEEEVES